jgi:hypothetical protein
MRGSVRRISTEDCVPSGVDSSSFIAHLYSCPKVILKFHIAPLTSNPGLFVRGNRCSDPGSSVPKALSTYNADRRHVGSVANLRWPLAACIGYFVALRAVQDPGLPTAERVQGPPWSWVHQPLPLVVIPFLEVAPVV